MEGLAIALQQGRTSVIDGLHRAELEAFEYEMRGNRIVYEAPPAMNDDVVCAHALAWYGAEKNGITSVARRVTVGKRFSSNSVRSGTW